MGVSRQAFYQGQRRHAQRESTSQAVMELVRDWRVRQPRLGTRKLYHVLLEPLARVVTGPRKLSRSVEASALTMLGLAWAHVGAEAADLRMHGLSVGQRFSG